MNETITTLGRVADHVEALSRNHHDELVPVKAVSFESMDEVRIGSEPHALRPVAARGIATRMGIPYPYLERCPRYVQAFNLNHWLRQERNDELFFRFDGAEVRAIFTPRYTPLDNISIVRQLDLLGFHGATPVQVVHDERFMLLNVTTPDRAFTVAGSDKMVAGFSIGNSEVGLSSLTVAAFVLRLVCTNGLIAREKAEAFSRRHISEDILEQFPRVLSQATQGVETHKRNLTLSLESPVKDPAATLRSFGRQFQLDTAEQEAVDWAWPYEQGDTLFNIVQTYTKASQHPPLVADSAYKLQRLGGTILSMVGDGEVDHV